MITLRQAVELTLSAIEEGVSFDHLDNVTAPMLRRALAEPQDPVAYDGWVLREVLFDNGEPVGHRAPEQEPVAWAHKGPLGYSFSHVRNEAFSIPLYTTPPQRKPLTDEEIDEMWREALPLTDEEIDDMWRDVKIKPALTFKFVRAFARDIEQEHGIKGDA